MRSAAAVLFATTLIALPAVADSIAAPGDCAQPLGEFVTPPVYSQSAGVAGSASDHFAPAATTGEVVRLLPLALTRATLRTTTQTTTDTAVTLVDQTLQSTTGIVREGTDVVREVAGPVVAPLEPIVAPLEPIVAPLEPVVQLEPVVAPVNSTLTNTLNLLGGGR